VQRPKYERQHHDDCRRHASAEPRRSMLILLRQGRST
jgi:hypothetical protein